MSRKRKGMSGKTRDLLIKIITIALIVITALSVLLPSLISNVYAASSKEIEAQINGIEQEQKDLENQVAELEEQLNQNAVEIKEMMDKKAILDQQISVLNEQIELVDEKIVAQAMLIADKQEELEIAIDKLEDLRAKHKDRLRTMEEDGKISYWSVVFKARSFADLLDKLNMIEEIAQADQKRIRELDKAADVVEEAKMKLEDEKSEIDAHRRELYNLEVELEGKKKDAEAILLELRARGEEFEQYIYQAEEELLVLEEELLSAKKELEEAKRKEYLAYIHQLKNNPGQVKVDKDGISWVVPCYYSRVSSNFGNRIHPVYNEPRMHNGVDLAGDCPTPIWATRGGIVVVSGWDSAAGYYVKIDHLDGYSSVYMHLCKMPNVRVGQVVFAGDKIGCMGTTGTSTGVHLHFGIQKNGRYVNPMRYIG